MKLNNTQISVTKKYFSNTSIPKKIFQGMSLLFLTFIPFGCRKESGPQDIKIANTTILVFMAANNNLKSAALNSINEMESAAKDLDGALFVLIKTSGYRSDLLRIKYDKSENIVSDTIKTYGSENTSNPDFLKKVIEDTKKEQVSHSFGLVLWSHGTSWYPQKKDSPLKPILSASSVQLKSFGYDRGEAMDILDLKKALPKDLKFILFDACSMGSLEVSYELKNNAAYIIASPTETLSTSFPYEKITPLLFGDVEAYKLLCKEYIDSYRKKSDVYQSASVVLIKTNALQDLSLGVKKLLSTALPLAKENNWDEIQRMDFDVNSPVAAYDFIDFLRKNFNRYDYFPVEQQFNRVVLYKGNTDKFLGKEIKQFGGLSTYLPGANETNFSYYKQLGWYDNAGYERLFNP